jgi:hypothetical protein
MNESIRSLVWWNQLSFKQKQAVVYELTDEMYGKQQIKNLSEKYINMLFQLSTRTEKNKTN